MKKRKGNDPADEATAAGSQTVAGPSPEPVDWLLTFSERDVEKLRPGELLDAATDLERYLLDGRMAIAPGEDGEPVAILKAGTSEPDPDPYRSWPHIQRRHLLQRLQTNLRAGMRGLYSGRDWSPFEEAPKDRATSPDDNIAPRWSYRRRKDGRLERRYEPAPLLTVLLVAAGDLLMQWWPQIRRCKYERCGAFFLRRHGHQDYHDKKCSGLARWHRHKKRDHKQELIRRRPHDELPKHVQNPDLVKKMRGRKR